MSEIAAGTNGDTKPWGQGVRALVALILLLVAADLLLWNLQPGINLALFFLAIAAAILALHRQWSGSRLVLPAVAMAVLGVLPLVEAPSFPGFLCSLFGVSFLALAASGLLPMLFEGLTGVLVRFGLLAPVRLAADAVSGSSALLDANLGGRIVKGLVIWLVPVGFALAFLMLFAEANPVIESALDSLKLEFVLDHVDPIRLIFWAMVAVVAWPVLSPRLMRAIALRRVEGPRRESLVFGRAAIVRSLIVFNALFAIQSVLDLAFLWGGVRLPQGLSYADYAHRGAYPLIVTALLAGAFVLAAMRPNGPAEQSPLIRRLVYLWVAQNVLLVISSILRLDLYVQVYSLTELRLEAGIWMGLVAVGLILIVARIALRRSNAWLITSNLVALGVTLYGYAFLDVSAIVARFNIENGAELTRQGEPVDLAYLLSLGPTVIPAIDYYLERAATRPEAERQAFVNLRRTLAAEFEGGPTDWRSWSFRDQRLGDYMAAHPDFASGDARAINGTTSP